MLAMAAAISVRLDDEAEQALDRLMATGLSRSAAIRTALIAAADRLRGRHDLAAEVAALEADEADREEMLAVASLMESLRGPGDVFGLQVPQGVGRQIGAVDTARWGDSPAT